MIRDCDVGEVCSCLSVYVSAGFNLVRNQTVMCSGPSDGTMVPSGAVQCHSGGQSCIIHIMKLHVAVDSFDVTAQHWITDLNTNPPLPRHCKSSQCSLSV